MNEKDLSKIYSHIEGLRNTLRGQKLTQTEANDIWVELMELGMLFRAAIEPVDLSDTELQTVRTVPRQIEK